MQLAILFPITKAQSSEPETPVETGKIFLNRDTKTIQNYNKTTENSSSDLLISIPGDLNFKEFVLPIDGNLQNYPQINRIDDVIVLQFRNVQLEKLKSTISNYVLPQLPVANGLQSNCTEISCSHCEHLLLNLSNKNFIWKDLPNEHWLELLDCWSCHDNEFAPIAERALNQKISHRHQEQKHEHEHEHKDNHLHKSSYDQLNNSTHGLILPPSGKLYLGMSHLLVNANDFSHTSCPQCNVNIGEVLKDDHHFKLYRDALIFKNISDTFVNESYMTLLMHRILDTIDNHSTFHFILASTDSSRLYIKPISWNLRIFDSKREEWLASFKVGYCLLTESSKLISEAESIHCTPLQFNQIKTHLETCHKEYLFNSSLKLPGSERLNISYLINKG